MFRPTWAEVDLGVLQRNLEKIRRGVQRSGARVLFVVKADAYGHGAAEVGRFVQRKRLADWLGVASVEEGQALRAAGVKLPVLILGSLYPLGPSYRAALESKLVPTVTSLDGAREFARVAKRFPGRSACHLKLETGMSRIGIRWPAAGELARVLHDAPKVELQGVYTHLAAADSDAAFTRRQLAQFAEAVRCLEAEGIRVPLRHVANSDGMTRFPKSHWDLVRPGIAGYGTYPGFQPALTWKTRVVFLKTVPPGTRVGYGSVFRAKRTTRLATLPVGYADGYWRALSGRGEVLIRGQRCKVAGRVSMDMTVVDVTRLKEVHIGDEAVVLGRQGRDEVPAAELARKVGTIPYEVTCRIAARVPRVYV